MSGLDLQRLIERLEVAVAKMETFTGLSNSMDANITKETSNKIEVSSHDLPAWLNDYNHFHNDVMSPFIDELQALGCDLEGQGIILKTVFNAHKVFLDIAGKYSRPNDNDLQLLVEPIREGINGIVYYRDRHRGSKQFKFLTAISEGVPFLGWVIVTANPVLYIRQIEESSQFFTNKVWRKFKHSDPKICNCAKSWITLIEVFRQYVCDHHPKGLEWNKDKPAATFSNCSSDYSLRHKTIHPPSDVGNDEEEMPDHSEIFAQIEKGSTKMQLNKVTEEMQTHKNPTLRRQGPVKMKQKQKFLNSTSSSLSANQQPVLELLNKKWAVEYQENNHRIVIEDTNEKQTVYMYKCNNSLLHVKGKLHTIIVDSCCKCGIVFDSLLSTSAFVNCESIRAQVNGTVPTISVEKTDGVQLYINEKSLMKTQIISAKSCQINICIMKEDGDIMEIPIKEQFKSFWDGNRLHTVPIEL